MAKVEEKLVSLIDRAVEGLGYELVDVERAGGGLLRVTLDAPAAPRGIGLDDCERVSHQLTHLLAVENVDYERLEVSSPGLDRRLSKPREFERFAGQEVQVQLLAPLNGRRRLRGRLLGLAGSAGTESVRLELHEGGPEGGPEEGSQGMGKRSRTTKARKSKAALPPPQVVEFALADVERARLVPVVNFRKSAAGSSGSAAAGSAAAGSARR